MSQGAGGIFGAGQRCVEPMGGASTTVAVICLCTRPWAWCGTTATLSRRMGNLDYTTSCRWAARRLRGARVPRAQGRHRLVDRGVPRRLTSAVRGEVPGRRLVRLPQVAPRALGHVPPLGDGLPSPAGRLQPVRGHRREVRLHDPHARWRCGPCRTYIPDGAATFLSTNTVVEHRHRQVPTGWSEELARIEPEYFDASLVDQIKTSGDTRRQLPGRSSGGGTRR